MTSRVGRDRVEEHDPVLPGDAGREEAGISGDAEIGLDTADIDQILCREEGDRMEQLCSIILLKRLAEAVRSIEANSGLMAGVAIG